MAGAEHPEELKRTLLQFVSSELTAHAATVVGISVLLFTAVNVFTRENFLPAIHFPMQLVISKITFDYAVVFFVFWMLCAGFTYSFMRLMFYGALADEILDLKGFSPSNLEDLRNKIAEKIAEKRGMEKVITWFSGGIGWGSSGFRFSLLIGLSVDVILFVVLFIN